MRQNIYQILPSLHLGTSSLTLLVIMGLAESTCLLLHYLDRRIHRKQYSSMDNYAKIVHRTPPPLKTYAALSLADVTASLIQLLAINSITPSFYELFRSCIIVSCFFFLKRIIGMPTKKHHVTGLLFTSAGLLLITGINLYNTLSSQEKRNLLYENWPYTTLITALLFIMVIIKGWQDVKIQQTFQKYHVQSLQLTGFVGVFSLCLAVFIVLGFNFTPCFWSQKCICRDGSYYLESVPKFFQELYYMPKFIGYTIGQFFIVLLINYLVNKLIQLTDCIACAGLYSCRLLFVWIIGVIITLAVGKPYQFQLLEWWYLLLKAVGIALIVFGMLLYTELYYNKRLSQRRDPTFEQIMTDKTSIYTE